MTTTQPTNETKQRSGGKNPWHIGYNKENVKKKKWGQYQGWGGVFGEEKKVLPLNAAELFFPLVPDFCVVRNPTQP